MCCVGFVKIVLLVPAYSRIVFFGVRGRMTCLCGMSIWPTLIYSIPHLFGCPLIFRLFFILVF